MIIGIKEIEEYRIEDKTEDRKDYFDYEESSSSSEDEDDLMKSMHIAGEKDEEKVCLLEPHTSIKVVETSHPEKSIKLKATLILEREQPRNQERHSHRSEYQGPSLQER